MARANELPLMIMSVAFGRGHICVREVVDLRVVHINVDQALRGAVARKRSHTVSRELTKRTPKSPFNATKGKKGR